MRLTQWTDYALRVLIYCAADLKRETAPTIAEVAQAYGISRSHLMKIVMRLSALGWLETTRGRGGGLRLTMSPQDISVGRIVRQMEEDFRTVECFDSATNTCRLDGSCRLKHGLQSALNSYLAVLDSLSLADVMPLTTDTKKPSAATMHFKPRAPSLS
jgi:Rrf2 family nitric oxide-sensitive transcriptional repressor